MEGHLTTLHKDHIAWQGDEPHTRLGGMEMDGHNLHRMYASARRSVSGLLFSTRGYPPDKSCRAYAIHVSDSWDGYVARWEI
jgi:hypothetical protein